jgi:hypothetical protein
MTTERVMRTRLKVAPPRAKIVPSFPPINPEPKMPIRMPLYPSFVVCCCSASHQFLQLFGVPSTL